MKLQFVAGHLLRTPKGLLPIEQIGQGDSIWSEEAWQEVTSAKLSSNKYALKIKTHLGSTIYVGPSCQFEVLLPDGTIQYREAAFVNRSYILVDVNRPFSKCLPKLPACSFKVPATMTVELAYLYGMFAGYDIERIPQIHYDILREQVNQCLLACFGRLPKSLALNVFVNLRDYEDEVYAWLKQVDITSSFGLSYVRRCTRAQAIAYLRAFWDRHWKTHTLRPFYQHLLQEIQTLLLDLNIVSDIRKNSLLLHDKRRFLEVVGMSNPLRLQETLPKANNKHRKWPLAHLFDKLSKLYRSKLPVFDVKGSLINTSVFEIIAKTTQDEEAQWVVELADRCIAVEVISVNMDNYAREIYEVSYGTE